MSASGSRAVEEADGAAVPADLSSGVPSGQVDHEGHGRPELTKGSEASVAEIRARLSSNACFLGVRLESIVGRRLGLAPLSTRAIALAGLLGTIVRLAVPFIVTALVGEWAGAPWWSWVLIAVWLGLGDVLTASRHPPQGTPAKTTVLLQEMTALVPTIKREEDLQQLAAFTRRWYRLRVSAPVAAAVAAIMLLACLVVAPEGFRELPAGSIAMLAILLYDFGETTFWNLFSWPFIVRKARYDHHLFWASPVDSSPVQQEIRVWATMQSVLGISVTLFLVLTVVLVTWDSPLVLPLAAGFIVMGYMTTFGTMAGLRGSVRRIVTRIRDRNLAALQRRIDAYGPRVSDLSAEEAEQVQHLISLHHTIRDSPITPRSRRTFLHAASALVIPTILFFLTVFSEVYAERILDTVLP